MWQSQLSWSFVGSGDEGPGSVNASFLDPSRPGTSHFQNSGPAGTLFPQGPLDRPDLTSKVGTPGPQSIKPNKGFNYLYDRGSSRHLCLIKVLVTSESEFYGTVFSYGLVVSLSESLTSFPTIKF